MICQLLLLLLWCLPPAFAQTPECNALCEKGVVAYRAGDFKEAERLYKAALDLNPAQNQARINLLENLRIVYEETNPQGAVELEEEIKKFNVKHAPASSELRRQVSQQPIKPEPDRPKKQIETGMVTIEAANEAGDVIVKGSATNNMDVYLKMVMISFEMTLGDGSTTIDDAIINGIAPHQRKNFTKRIYASEGIGKPVFAKVIETKYVEMNAPSLRQVIERQRRGED